jgi:hypothetical protein
VKEYERRREYWSRIELKRRQAICRKGWKRKKGPLERDAFRKKAGIGVRVRKKAGTMEQDRVKKKAGIRIGWSKKHSRIR